MAKISKKLRIKWNFELTVFELTVPNLYLEIELTFKIFMQNFRCVPIIVTHTNGFRDVCIIMGECSNILGNCETKATERVLGYLSQLVKGLASFPGHAAIS